MGGLLERLLGVFRKPKHASDLPEPKALFTDEQNSECLHPEPIRRSVTTVVHVTEPVRPIVAFGESTAMPNLEFAMASPETHGAHRSMDRLRPELRTDIDVDVGGDDDHTDESVPADLQIESIIVPNEKISWTDFENEPPVTELSAFEQVRTQPARKAPPSAELLAETLNHGHHQLSHEGPTVEHGVPDVHKLLGLDSGEPISTPLSMAVPVPVPVINIGPVPEAGAKIVPAEPALVVKTLPELEIFDLPVADVGDAANEQHTPTAWRERSVGGLVLEGDCSVRLSNCITANQDFFTEWTIGRALADRPEFVTALMRLRSLGRKTANEVLDALDAFARNPRIEDGRQEDKEDEPVPAAPLAALDQATLDESITATLRGCQVSARLANLLATGAVDGVTVRDFILHPDQVRSLMMDRKNAGRKTVTEAFDILSAHVEALGNPDLGMKSVYAEDEAPEGFTTHEWMEQEISLLPTNRVEVLHSRYGLNRQHPMTLQEIAERVHVTRERVRQVEAKAIKGLRAAGRSRAAFVRHLAESRNSQWSILFGPELTIPENEVSQRFRRLDPWFLLAIDIVFEDGRNGYLTANAHKTATGWFRNPEEAEERQKLDRAIEDLVGVYRTPMPLDTLQEIAPTVMVSAPAEGNNWTLRNGYLFAGYIGSKARRIVQMHAVARRISQAGVFDMGTLIIQYRNEFPDDECGSRMFDMQADEAPHLFTPLFDGIWLCLDHTSGQVDPLLAPPFERRQVEETHFAEGSLGDCLVRRLKQFGPQRAIDLRRTMMETAPGSFSESSVGAVLISNPCFQRAAPGIFGLYGDAQGAHPRIDAHLLDDRHCRMYCNARHSGAPQDYYPLWGGSYEMRLANWAQRHAPVDLYRSLMAVIEPEKWPAPIGLIKEFQALRSKDGRWEIGATRRLALGNRFLDPGQFLSALTHLMAFNWISWIGVNRATGSKPDAHDAADVLAFFVMSGLVEPESNWQAPHHPTDLAKRLFLEAKWERHLYGNDSSGRKDVFSRLRSTLYESPPTASRGWVDVEEFTTAMVAWQSDGIWMGKAFGGAQTRQPSINAEESFESDDWDSVFGG